MRDIGETVINILVGLAVVASIWAAVVAFSGCSTDSNIKFRDACAGYHHPDDRIRCEREGRN